MKHPTGLSIAEHSAYLTSHANASGVVGTKDFICMLCHDCVAVNPKYSVVNEEMDVLDPEICEYIIKRAEDFAAKNGDWTTGRHTAYATTDFPIGTRV
jgi:hypothetical protein